MPDDGDENNVDDEKEEEEEEGDKGLIIEREFIGWDTIISPYPKFLDANRNMDKHQLNTVNPIHSRPTKDWWFAFKR